MEKEISSGAMLGIVLIALAAIIGIGFGIFSIAKGTANEGVVNVQDNLAQVSASVFTDYDQKVVTGTQVISAYNNFAGKPYAILIATQAYIDSLSSNDNPVLSGAPPVEVYSGDPGGNATKEDFEFLNYNAILAGTTQNVVDNDGKVVDTNYIDAKIYFQDGAYIATNGFLVDTSGRIIYNSVIGNLSKPGTVEYVPSSARFQANLIKDKSGTIMGVAFRQLPVR